MEMEQEQHCYQIIKAVLSEHGEPPYNKEEIKSAIVNAIHEYDYVSAIIAYLWGAYNHLDPTAKIAFNEIFFDDLKKHEQTAFYFYFFSFYFTHDFKRAGFDRRRDEDRRKSYSLDFFSETDSDLRKGAERRKRTEKRVDWTRVTEWSSVPFKSIHHRDEPDMTIYPDKDKEQEPDQFTDKEYPLEADLRGLNATLSDLVTYFDNYIKQDQTDWASFVDQETFGRAKDVMRKLVEINLTSL